MATEFNSNGVNFVSTNVGFYNASVALVDIEIFVEFRAFSIHFEFRWDLRMCILYMTSTHFNCSMKMD